MRQKSLAIYTTQETDVQKGISRIPLPLARLQEEDLVDIERLVLSKEDCFDLHDDEDVEKEID